MTRTFAVVTSFSAKQWEDDLTREAVRTMIQYWPCEKMVYVNGGECGVRDYAVQTYNLDLDSALWTFKQRYQNITKPMMWPKHCDGRLRQYDYRFDVCKFAHKIFALYRAGRESNADTIIWLDADVVTMGEITADYLDLLIPEDCLLSYLGRNMPWTSECGFVGYNSRRFLQAFRSMYVTGDIFKLDEWHDSFVFDHLRTHWKHGGYFHNISRDVGDKHVWPDSILGVRMKHLKGPARKRHGRDFTDDELKVVTEAEGMRVVQHG